MIAPLTIAQRIAASRLVGLLPAIEGTLKPLFPGVTVKAHPGKIDVSDVIEKDIFQAPMIALALTRWHGPVGVNGSWQIQAELAAYVITEDMAIAAKSVPRQDIAFALSHGVLDILADLDVPRWGLPSITSPTRAEARPLFTSITFAKGAAYYVVTWEQALIGLGDDPLPHVLITGVETSWDGSVETIDDGGPV